MSNTSCCHDETTIKEYISIKQSSYFSTQPYRDPVRFGPGGQRIGVSRIQHSEYALCIGRKSGSPILPLSFQKSKSFSVRFGLLFGNPTHAGSLLTALDYIDSTWTPRFPLPFLLQNPPPLPAFIPSRSAAAPPCAHCPRPASQIRIRDEGRNSPISRSKAGEARSARSLTVYFDLGFTSLHRHIG